MKEPQINDVVRIVWPDNVLGKFGKLISIQEQSSGYNYWIRFEGQFCSHSCAYRREDFTFLTDDEMDLYCYAYEAGKGQGWQNCRNHFKF